MKPIEVYNKVKKAQKPGEHYTKTLKRLGITQKQYFSGRAANAGMAGKGIKKPRKKGTLRAKATAPVEAGKGGKVMVILASLEEVRELLS